MKLYIDVETRSGVSIKTTNPYRYAEDPDFAVLMCAYAVNDGPVLVAIGHDEIRRELGKLLTDPDVLKVAHNAAFERVTLGRALGLDGPLDPRQFEDTMARAGTLGLPQGLDALAQALGAAEKDSAGASLINWFCSPLPRRSEFRDPAEHPEKWAQFVAYCAQDVETMRDIDRLMPDWPTEHERKVWVADQIVNDRGVPFDDELARAAVAAGEANGAADYAAMQTLLGIDNPRSNTQLLPALAAAGYEGTDLRAATVKTELERARTEDNAPLVRALELRQDLALIASKKFEAGLRHVTSDGRLHGQLRYFGAHTGRWSGRGGIQVQNLPREQLPGLSEDDDVDVALDTACLDLLLTGEADPVTLKALVRASLTGPLTVCDYSAIEARVLAWLAGERWTLDAFRSGEDIYVTTAERMGGLTRQEGKVAVLALGYGGSVGALRAMGYGADLDDEEVKPLVYAWRGANPAIVAWWSQLEQAFRDGGTAGKVRVEIRGRDRYVWLPSGRPIVYRDVRYMKVKLIDPKTNEPRLDWEGRPRMVWRATFKSPLGPRADTYGGRLAENVTQAVARDVLAHALVAAVEAGLPITMSVHDELVAEGECYDKLRAVMLDMPDWSDGLPMNAEGFTAPRYRKG